MSSAGNQKGTRYINVLKTLLRRSLNGVTIDDRASAHDTSNKGFKVETQAELIENETIFFTLELPSEEIISGEGRVIWSRREPLAFWAGIQFVKLTWKERRRLSRFLYRDTIDWARLLSLSVRLVSLLTVITVAQGVLYNTLWRNVFAAIVLKVIALLLMGWSLAGLLRSREMD